MKRVEVPARDGAHVELTAGTLGEGSVWLWLEAARAKVGVALCPHEARSLAYVLHSLQTEPVSLHLENGDVVEVAPWGISVMITGTRDGVSVAVSLAHRRVADIEDALFRLADHARFSADRTVVA